MNERQPPASATWLLRHVGCSPNNAAIVGDLSEQYLRGRSPFWYWGQVFIAVLVGLKEAVTEHKLLALRCIALGWAMIALYAALLAGYVVPLVIAPGYGHLVSFLFATIGAAHVGRYYLFYDLARGLFILVLIFLSCLAGLHTGATMARSHRPYQRPFVLLFALTACTVVLISFGWHAMTSPGTSPVNAIMVLVGNSAWIGSTIVGAGLLHPSPESQSV